MSQAVPSSALVAEPWRHLISMPGIPAPHLHTDHMEPCPHPPWATASNDGQSSLADYTLAR